MDPILQIYFIHKLGLIRNVILIKELKYLNLFSLQLNEKVLLLYITFQENSIK